MNKIGCPTFIDIDGTLTESAAAGGVAIPSRVASIRARIERGELIVIWSGTGTEYARQFAGAHGLKPLAAIGKPSLCVDDCPTIRPRLDVASPEEFFGE